jgi:hypothetical protein
MRRAWPFRKKARAVQDPVPCFNPALCNFELNGHEDVCGFPPSLVRQAGAHGGKRSVRQQVRGSRRESEPEFASVTVTFYGIEPAAPSLLGLHDLLLGFPINARRFIAGATAGELFSSSDVVRFTCSCSFGLAGTCLNKCLWITV